MSSTEDRIAAGAAARVALEADERGALGHAWDSGSDDQTCTCGWAADGWPKAWPVEGARIEAEFAAHVEAERRYWWGEHSDEVRATFIAGAGWLARRSQPAPRTVSAAEVERGAQVAYERAGLPTAWEAMPDFSRTIWRRLARAVIEAALDVEVTR